jgi:hypothetical protein
MHAVTDMHNCRLLRAHACSEAVDVQEVPAWVHVYWERVMAYLAPKASSDSPKRSPKYPAAAHRGPQHYWDLAHPPNGL